MLIKRHIVERWYLKTSPVYKNFAYLFCNPLWEKPIPSGFSVCPYFWLSVFSLLIFRPFAWVSKKVFFPIGKTVVPPALGLLIGFALVWGLAIAIFKYIHLYASTIHPIAELEFLNWIAVSLIGMGIFWSWDLSHDYNWRWKRIFGIWASVVSILSIGFFPAHMKRTLMFIIYLLKCAVGILWYGLSNLGLFLWLMLKGLCVWIWHFLSWVPFYRGIPWVVYLAACMAILVGALFLLDFLMTRYERHKTDWYYDWQELLIWLVDGKAVRKLIFAAWGYGSMPPYGFTRSVISRLVNPLVCDLRLTPLPPTAWKKRYDTDRDIDLVELNVRLTVENLRKYDSIKLFDISKQNIRDIVRSEMGEDYVKRFLVDPTPMIWGPMWKRVKRIAWIPVTIIVRLSVITGKVLLTFFAYLWMLIVAKKKGACPYFTFREE